MHASVSRRRLARSTALAAIAFVAAISTARGQSRDTIPSQAYYTGIEELYTGDFRDAQRAFSRSLTGAVKTLGPTGTIRWVDSICYHAMLGEVYYHWGQPQQALAEFNNACLLYLQNPRWLMRVQFSPQVAADPALARTTVPWGVSQRQAVPGKFPTTFPVPQGQLDASQQLQQGGVVMAPQLWPVDVVEVVRSTALAIRRRNELLGPLGPHDTISKNLASTLARGSAKPNHWSGAWGDVLRGLALAGIGDREQAVQYLDRGTLVSGQFDHPLTCMALLEQGRLALDEGNVGAATSLLAEAGYSAYLFGDAGVVDDSFRWGALARIAANAPGVNPALQNAAAWARRDRFDYLAARLNLILADELMIAGDWKNAAAALAAGIAQLGDARTGALGNQAQYLDARVQFQQGRDDAEVALAAAVAGQRKISHHNFQLALANEMFDAQTLPLRSAPLVYEALLADPTPADTTLRPLETLAVMTTPHGPAFDRWLVAALDRKNLAAVLEITDRAKRRRYHNALPWGGRLAALRILAAAPSGRLAPSQRQQRHELLAKFPQLARAVGEESELRGQLGTIWRPPLDADAQKKSVRLWGDLTAAVDRREAALRRIGTARVPADVSFPPLLTALEIQSRLEPGQALLVYHDTADGMLALLVTSRAAAHWNCGHSNKLAGSVAKFLRELGNYDGNHETPIDDLANDKWQAEGARMFKAMFAGASIEPAAMKELIVVPDGIAWYVPFEALTATIDDQMTPLIVGTKVRYAPTAGLAFSFEGPWRRVQRTGLAVGEMAPGDKPEQKQESLAALQGSLPGVVPLTPPLTAPSPVLASMLEELVVIDDVDSPDADPFAWSPLPVDRGDRQGDLERWLELPGIGPQRILLPGMHTAAERGGKAPRRRRGSAGAAPGDEFFFASCGLMSAGAETLLLSRWRVGGQTTLDLTREFAQELPHMAAADAWQRSVELIRESPVDPTVEPRVKPGKAPVELTAKHPFFWAGYLTVDSGWRPAPEEPSADAAGKEGVPVGAAPQPNAPRADAPPAVADPKAPAAAPNDVDMNQRPDENAEQPKSPAVAPPPPTPPAEEATTGDKQPPVED